MGTASGINKQVKYKVESAWGVAPTIAAAQLLRRVTADFNLTKDTYESAEIRPDYQVGDFRHGIRRAAGSVNGELSPKTYSDFMAAVLKKDFAAGAVSAGVSLTIGGTLGNYTWTRAAGSWLTDGVKIGDTVRITVGAVDANNTQKNFFVTNVTALVLTGLTLNGTVLVPQGPIAGVTVAVAGKKTYTPATGHTDKSFAFEMWYPDVPTSEMFLGCKPTRFSIGMPATGMATCSIDFTGKDMAPPAAVEYFTNPNAITTTGILAGVNGVLRVDGVTMANITGFSIDVGAGQSGEPVVGSNTLPVLSPQRVIVSGQFTATFDSGQFRDDFSDEDEIVIAAAFTTTNAANSDFVGITMSRAKLGGATKDDGEKTIVATYPFRAILNVGGGAALASDATTLVIQDSAA